MIAITGYVTETYGKDSFTIIKICRTAIEEIHSGSLVKLSEFLKTEQANYIRSAFSPIDARVPRYDWQT